jgi:hypothetical protein
LKKKILKLTAFIKPDGIHIQAKVRGKNHFYSKKLTNNFNDVLLSVGATWTFNKYNNIEK